VTDPVPQRIGDADRDRAAEYLREHLAVGRLTQDEFDERLSAALQAKTAPELDPLFADLPAPKPGDELTPAEGSAPWPVYQPPAHQPAANHPAVPSHPAAMLPPPQSSTAKALSIAAGIAWPAWILFCFATSWNLWWLVFIPIVISSMAGQQRKEQERREELWQKRQNPPLPPGGTS
jgi:hypothetical protein